MKKIKIVQPSFGSFSSRWLQPILQEHFDLEIHDPEHTYPKGSIFLIKFHDFKNNRVDYKRMMDQGFSVVVDNLWEIPEDHGPGIKTLHTDKWFWYNEALWYRYAGYDQYKPAHNNKYVALMPMNLERPHRNIILKKLEPCLDKIMWSYVSKGKRLPNDSTDEIKFSQRHFDPSWYDLTYCSLVVETSVDDNVKDPFITEKTFKPIAFYHPFIVYGNKNLLKKIQSMGFETFDNLWDETYDSLFPYVTREIHIVDLINKLCPGEYDTETWNRLQHNHDRFFDTDLIKQGIVKEIVEPLLEYAST